MGETCGKTRILAVVVSVLALALAAVVAAFIYRETRGQNKRTELNENTVQDLYPGFFRSLEEQRVFNASFQGFFYFTRTVITPTVRRGGFCSFKCTASGPARRKRETQNGVQHGCCTSKAGFRSPTTYTNHNGVDRTLLQYENKKQFFTVHSCEALIDCGGCVCSQERNLAAGVVLRDGVTEANALDDTEIDYFWFPGCCKCVNT